MNDVLSGFDFLLCRSWHSTHSPDTANTFSVLIFLFDFMILRLLVIFFSPKGESCSQTQRNARVDDQH